MAWKIGQHRCLQAYDRRRVTCSGVVAGPREPSIDAFARSLEARFIGAGIAFLVVFIATYFYGIEVSMLTKSITLVATGAAVLAARWLLLKVTAGPVEGGASHA